MNRAISTILSILITIGLIVGVGYAVVGVCTGKFAAITGSVENIKAYAPSSTSGYNSYNLTMNIDQNTGIPISAGN